MKISHFISCLLLLLCSLPAAQANNGLEPLTALNSQQVEPVGLDGEACDRPANRSAGLLNRTYQFKNAAGTPAYYKEAHAFYCRAARYGDVEGYYMLGWLYANGRGVEKNDRVATRLYSVAAEQGHAKAADAMLALASPEATEPEMPNCLLADPPAVAETSAAEISVAEEAGPVFYSDGPVLRLVEKHAPNFGIDTDLAMAFIAVESGFNAKAVSPKNAQGLMQLIPETAERFRVKNAFDAEQNIKGGLAYLQWLLAYFKGNVELVAAAYNSGEKTVERYKGVPPYPETRNYVKKIATYYRKPQHPFKEGLLRVTSSIGLP